MCPNLSVLSEALLLGLCRRVQANTGGDSLRLVEVAVVNNLQLRLISPRGGLHWRLSGGGWWGRSKIA